jgi:hypothetical protein
MCFFSKTSIVHGNKLLSQLVYVKPACLCQASFHGRLEHLQTTTHYRENEEIRREAE